MTAEENRVRAMLHDMIDAVLRERLPALVENALNNRLVTNERNGEARLDIIEGYIRRLSQSHAQLAEVIQNSAEVAESNRKATMHGIGTVIGEKLNQLSERLDELEEKDGQPPQVYHQPF